MAFFTINFELINASYSSMANIYMFAAVSIYIC